MDSVEPFSLKGAQCLAAWVNSVYQDGEREIASLADFQHGDNFLLFVERLSKTTELRKRSKKAAANVSTAIQFLAKHLLYDWAKAKEHVLSGNESLISSLVFTLALHYVMIPWVVSRGGNPKNWQQAVFDALAMIASKQRGSYGHNHLDPSAYCSIVMSHCPNCSFSSTDVNAKANAPALQFKLVLNELYDKFRVPKMLKPHEFLTLDSRLVALYIILMFRALDIDANSTKTARLDRVHVVTTSTSDSGMVSFSSERRPKKPLPDVPQEDTPSDLEDFDVSELIPPGITLLPSNRYCVAMTEELATPKQRSQMDIFPGDLIMIEESFITGWMRGCVLGTDRFGIFPSHAVEEVLVSHEKTNRSNVVSVSARRGWKPPAVTRIWQRAQVSPMPPRRAALPADEVDDDYENEGEYETTTVIEPPVMHAPPAPQPWHRRSPIPHAGSFDSYHDFYQILVLEDEESLFSDLTMRCSMTISERARADLIEDDLKLLSSSAQRVRSVLLTLIELNFVTNDRRDVLVGMYSLVEALLHALSGIRAPQNEDEQHQFLTIVRNIITVLSQVRLKSSRTLEAQQEWVNVQREVLVQEKHHHWVQNQHNIWHQAAKKRKEKLLKREEEQQYARELQWEGLLQAAQEQKQAEVSKLSTKARLQLEEAHKRDNDALLVELRTIQQQQVSMLCSMIDESPNYTTLVPVLITLLTKISSPHFSRFHFVQKYLSATIDAVKKAVKFSKIAVGEEPMLAQFLKEFATNYSRLSANLSDSKEWKEVSVTFRGLATCVRQQLISKQTGRTRDVIFNRQTDLVKERFLCATLSAEVAPLGVKLEGILDGASVLGTYCDDHTQRELATRSAQTINAFMKYSMLSDEIHIQDYEQVVNDAHEAFEMDFLRLKNFMYEAKERRNSSKLVTQSIDILIPLVYRFSLTLGKGDEIFRPGASSAHLRDFASKLAGYYRALSSVVVSDANPIDLKHHDVATSVSALLEGVRNEVGLLTSSDSRTVVMGLTYRVSLAALYILRSLEELSFNDTICFDVFQSLVTFFRGQMKQALAASLKCVKAEILFAEKAKSAKDSQSWQDLQSKVNKSPRDKQVAQLKMLRGQLEAPFEFALSEHSKTKVSLVHTQEKRVWIQKVREATKFVALELKKTPIVKAPLCKAVKNLAVLARTTAISMTRDEAKSKRIMECGAELCSSAINLSSIIAGSSASVDHSLIAPIAQAIKALLSVVMASLS